MKKTRLLIVEGLPGSGKSTAARRIADALAARGQRVYCFDEGDQGHPADYDDYDFPDFLTERSLILQKWRDFVAAAQPGATYVFNCVFLQNPMCETMMRFGMSEAESAAYIREIADIIRPMEPLILYLDTPDVRRDVEAVLAERGGEWLQAVIGYHVDQGYGRAQGLTGFDGYIACLRERGAREKRILASVSLAYLVASGRSAADFLVRLLSDAE